MISQNSNNQPAGSTAVQCDAGIPIMGRTSDTGVYQILKVNADGSLGGFPSNADNTGIAYIDNPVSYPLNPVALHAAGQLIAYADIVTTAITEGLYRISPFYMAQCAAGAYVNFVLVKVGTTADAYLSTLNIGADGYAPNMGQMSGVQAFWHYQNMQPLGSNTVSMNYGNNNNNSFPSQDIFLTAGLYKLAVVVEVALTNTDPTTYIGVQQFLKIA